MKTLHPVCAVALVYKKGNALGEAACREAGDYLAGRGIVFSISEHPSTQLARSLVSDADLCLAFAGDGTMVSVARQILDAGIPIAGVNFGRVGFLAELSPDNWREQLAGALDRGIYVERRMSLRWVLYRGKKRLRQGEVINDVVVTRGKVARLVNLHLAVNGEPFVDMRSDGLILSTPTGSSGYAGSAGGPLLMPGLDAYVVAAICPYLSKMPPLVLSPETVVSVTVGEDAPDLYLTLDGQESYPLTEQDRLEVRGEVGRIHMADFGLKNYFERLQRTGFVQVGGGR
ncbi:NAD(+)/NADH kinase [Desulfovibrio sp. OttesenSCG-928-M16]|nr:NAD(+)/NADH kinase [Desulfovibrio sp. OttesenSCG-928-M16]